MKKLNILYFFVALFSLSACQWTAMKVGGMDPIDSIQVVRYDRVEARYLTTGDFAALQEMNTAYPTQTRALIEDLLRLGDVSDININRDLLNYFQDNTLQDVVYAAESEFADMDDINKELQSAFARLRKEIPNCVIPVFYAQIGAFQQSIVVDDDAIGISLDKYLGEDFPHYERFYEKSQRATMTRKFIVPDCLVFYLLSQYSFPDYDNCGQDVRDMHMGIIMWITNQILDKEIFESLFTKKVDAYMKRNPEMTIRKLLELGDYSAL